ncbi:MAG: hypothetical protein ABJB02_06385 [Dokdonella sp.]
MILGFTHEFPADDAERALPDAVSARALLGERAAPLEALLTRRAEGWGPLIHSAADAALLARIADAVRLAHARLALRHGQLGNDFHAYHNEGHILEICGGRIDRLQVALGLSAFRLREWCALMLFGAGHDLRQREARHALCGVGANERASIEETQRILDVCGFSREGDADFYAATELMIAGSTFDARPPPDGHLYNAADMVQSGGALADRLESILDAQRPHWREDPLIVQAQRLALVAADLDTANVAESFRQFATTAENLCRECEMLSGRSLNAGESALPVLLFLTDGQERFFFELHRFQSESGRRAFEAGKQANGPQLKALCLGVRARIATNGAPVNGDQVIAVYRAALAAIVA